MATQEHSKLAPSAAKRWMNCPGCIRLAEGIEEQPSVYAEEGTAAHFVAEYCLSHHCSTEGLLDPGWDIWQEHKQYVNQEMLNFVQLYLDTIRADLKEGGEMKAESRVDITWLVPDLFGTVDTSISEFMGLLRIYDLKYGAGVTVEPEHNPQQMLYALGMLGESNADMYEEVEIVIVQPRISHPEGKVRRWRVSVEQLYQWSKEIQKAAKATEDPHAPLAAGEWCQFCTAMPVCPEVVLEASKSAMIEFAPDASIEDITTNVTLPAPDAMNESQIGRVLQFARIMSSWVKSVEEYALSRMQSGVLVPGFKLVSKRSNRKWINEQAVIDDLEMLYGDNIYVDPKLKSPNQMESIPGIDKKALATLWENPPAGNTIAPEDDKRQAANPSAVEDFLF